MALVTSGAAPRLPLAARWRSLRSVGLALAVTVLVGAAAPPASSAQSGADRQHAIYVTVTDRAGKPVAGIKPADLVVREDGVTREVLRVEPATAPIEITLLVDTSDVASPQIADIRRALTTFVDDMAKDAEIAIATTGGRPEVVQNYTRNTELLHRAIGRVFAESGSGAYLLEALSSAARGVEQRAPERAAIVAIVVQAAPEFSSDTSEPVVKALRDSGAEFDAIVLAPQAVPTAESGPPPVSPAERLDERQARRDRDTVLDQASRATGGVNLQALSGMALTPQFQALATQLRSQYRVVYARPESLIPPEKIEVAAKKPGLVARGTPVRPQR